MWPGHEAIPYLKYCSIGADDKKSPLSRYGVQTSLGTERGEGLLLTCFNRYRIIVEFRVRVSSSSFEFELELNVRKWAFLPVQWVARPP